MLYREIFRILGQFCSAFALVLAIPLAVAVYYEFIAQPEFHPQPHSTWAFLETIAFAMLLSLFFSWLGRKGKGIIYRREGLILVVAIWILTPFISMLPYLFSGTLEHPVQAYFEAVSGLTTTGATLLEGKQYDPQTGKEVMIHREVRGDVVTNYNFWGTVAPVRDTQGNEVYHGVEAVSKSILFWRCFTQWIGGIGIIVIFISVLPALGVGGKILFQAESPGPIKETLTPRLIETAGMLWKIYLGLTVIQIMLLMLFDPTMTLFEAVCTSFSTLSTGGFSVRNDSIGTYANVHIYWIVAFFMLLGSINFSLYFHLLRGKFYRLKDPELITYLTVVLLTGGFVAFWLWNSPKVIMGIAGGGVFTFWEAMIHGFFQTISAQTSTGFVTADYDKWPFAPQGMMLILMFVGGMSGSTSGGIKMMRHIILFRVIQNRLELLFRPATVRIYRMGKMAISSEAAQMVLCFFVVFVVSAVVGTFFFVMDGIDPETAFSVAASSINNAGLAFRKAGPTESFAFLSPASCIFSSFLMILGRLELFALLVILLPAFWRQDR